MENQPEIGGARALLLLGVSKLGDDDSPFEGDHTSVHGGASAHDGTNVHGGANVHDGASAHDGASVHGGASAHDGANVHDGTNVHDGANVPDSPPGINQQINDAVVAAVMRYVGGTLDTATENSLTSKKRRSQNDPKLIHDDHVDGVDELDFNQWTGFLADNMSAEHRQNGDFVPDLLDGRPNSTKKQKLLEIELPDLENDQLMEAALRNARHAHVSADSHPIRTSAGHVNGVSNNRHAPSLDLNSPCFHPRKDISVRPFHSKVKDNHPGNVNAPLPAKAPEITRDHRELEDPSNHRDPIQCRKRSEHNARVESLVDEASRITCSWFFSLPDSTKKGPRKFSSQEIDGVEHFIQGYCKIHNWSRKDACARIWSSKRQKDNFWEALTRVLPYRSRASVYKHVRRQYHVFSVRAKWTPQEDAELSQWGQTHEGKWKQIGEAMGRMPEDCRDRWRNYVKCGDNRSSNSWLAQEEQQLCDIVGQLLQEADLDMAINWTVVSERMNGSRSRIQCRYKWTKMQKRKSLMKTAEMSDEIRSWLLYKLRDTGYPDVESVDWKLLAESVPLELNRKSAMPPLLPCDLKFAFEKMREDCKETKSLTFLAAISKLSEQYAAPPRYSESGTKPSNPVEAAALPTPTESPTERSTGDLASIANAVASVVPSSVPEDLTRHQQYTLWR